MRRILLSLMAAICAVMTAVPALAEIAFLPGCEDWSLDEIPLELTLSAEVTSYSPFGDDRLPQLTNLLKHLSLRITRQPLVEEVQSTVSVLVDGDETLTLGLQESEQQTLAQFSALPDVTFAGTNPLAALLGASSEPMSVLGLDGTEAAWLEEGYALLSALEEALAPYLTSETSVKTDIKNMGTARIKQDYTVSKDDAPGLSALLTAACPEGRLRTLLSKLVFSGKQTLRVYRAADGSPLRMEWNGNCGVDADHLRDVNLTWRMRRDDTACRDELSLKSPALKGTDRNTLDWSCNILPGKKTGVTMDGKLSYAAVSDKQKTTLSGSFKLTSEETDQGTRVTGEVSITRQLPDEDNASGYKVEPDLLFSGDANMPTIQGTLTVSGIYASGSGTKVADQAILTLDLHRTGYSSWQMRSETVDLTALDAAALEAVGLRVKGALSSALIRRLTLLPLEDLDYLFLDLPEESVQAIINAAQAQ